MDYNANEPDRRNVKTDRLMSVLLGGAAVVVYGMTLMRGVFPGESAQLMTFVSGLNPWEAPAYPIFHLMTSWLSSLAVFTLPVRLNLFSLACSVLAVVLVYRVVSFFVRDVITEETSHEFAPRASTAAGVIAAVTFMCSIPVWQAATRFQYQNFDLLFPLLAAQMLVWFAMYRWRVFLALFVVVCGLGVVESSTIVPTLPLLAVFAVYVLWRAQALSFLRVAWMAGAFALVLGVLFFGIANQFFRAEDCAAMGLESLGDVMVRMLKVYIGQLCSGLPHLGWMLFLLMGVVPFLTSALAAFRGLNNERSMSQYALHFALSVIVVMTLTNLSISPWETLKPSGRLPVGIYAMTAMATGYLFAYWYLLLKVRASNRTHHVPRLVRRTGEWMGLLVAYPFVLIVTVASLLNSFECNSKRGMFADRCAREILDRMGTRTWLVTDGTLDPHLLIMAKERGMDLGLFSLYKEDNKYYLSSLWKQIEAKQVFAEEDRQKMRTTLEQLGVISFLQDWFMTDKAIDTKVAVFNIPDLWVAAGLTPVPDFFFFSGSRDITTLADQPLLEKYMAFWKSMEPDLSLGKRSNEAIERDPLERIRKRLRRHMGFVANNLGVLLEDLGNNKDAFAVYNYVTKSIDAENISSLFNRFEMTLRGVDITETYKDQIEKELKAVINQLLRDQRRYPLWSLSRYYGYVRSPEIYAMMGWGWAISGQTAAARMNMSKLIDLLPEERRIAALQAMARTLVKLPEPAERIEAERILNEIIEADPNDLMAMLGKLRMDLQRGDIVKAKAWLERLKEVEPRPGAFGVEWATFHLMNTNSAQARVTLQQTTDLQPRNLQAWAMLALLQLQQDEVDDVENVILPRMENITGDGDSYFTRITRAQLALKKAEPLRRAVADAQEKGQSASPVTLKNLDTLLRQARESYIRAAELDPTVQGTRDLVLQLNMEMNDRASAEKYARQILRTNRDHPLANYVLGSLRLQERAYGEAEDLLKRSVAREDTPAALNDLAEVLRRIKKFDEAEKFARKALEKAPTLYVAWETLGAILLDANKNLDEAEQMVLKALALYDKDVRIKITLARIQLRRGDLEHARDTISQIESKRGDLTPFDVEELAKVKTEMASAKIPRKR